MKITKDKIIFSSGRESYVNLGIVGICPDLEISQGYDGVISVVEYDDHEFTPKIFLTKDDRQELAEYMISLWRQFAELDDEHFLSDP